MEAQHVSSTQQDRSFSKLCNSNNQFIKKYGATPGIGWVFPPPSTNFTTASGLDFN